jgi:hypothetical protein
VRSFARMSRDELDRELVILRRFYGEVQGIACCRPLEYVPGWGSARSTLAMIEREVDAIEKQIQKLQKNAAD